MVSAGERAMVVFFRAGGSNLSVLEEAALVGVVRDDVTRVVASIPTGKEVDLPLNGARAFSYLATSAHAIPSAITAYGGSGQVERIALHASAPNAK